jgi:hypothetical protein
LVSSEKTNGNKRLRRFYYLFLYQFIHSQMGLTHSTVASSSSRANHDDDDDDDDTKALVEPIPFSLTCDECDWTATNASRTGALLSLRRHARSHLVKSPRVAKQPTRPLRAKRPARFVRGPPTPRTALPPPRRSSRLSTLASPASSDATADGDDSVDSPSSRSRSEFDSPPVKKQMSPKAALSRLAPRGLSRGSSPRNILFKAKHH